MNRRAVIDVGSGSVVLAVAERESSGWTQIHSTSEMTFLGEGVKQTGVLTEEAMARTLAAVKRGFQAARERGADVLAAGTMALRLAENREEFLSRAAAQGTPLVLLSAENEAEFGFRAVAEDPAFAAYHRRAIIDVGGQSTELVVANLVGTDWSIEHRVSYPLGTLQMRGGILSAETPSVEDIFRASVEIDDTLDKIPMIGDGVVITLGAPGTDLIGVRDQLTEWRPDLVHGAYLDYEEVGKAVGWLMRMTDEGRSHAGPFEPGREKTVHTGTLILERFLNALAAPGCFVSIRGWRHALLESDWSALQ